MEVQIMVRQHISITILINWLNLQNLYHLFPLKACLHNDATNIDQKIKKNTNTFLCANLNIFFFTFRKAV